MACNCCTPSGCKCKLSNAENAETFTFSYSLYHRQAPWIHRKYPETMFSAVWDENYNAYLANNHIIKDGELVFYGDLSWNHQTRNGLESYFAEVYGGYIVENYNGDNSPWADGGFVFKPIMPMTVFALEEKQDDIKRECQLWVKFRNITFDEDTNAIIGDWGELELLDSRKWNEPIGPQIEIIILGSKFNGGADKVELRYFCVNPCFLFEAKTFTVTGQASWITESVIELPLDYCKSYGKFDGNYQQTFKNCPDYYSAYAVSVNSKSEKIFVNFWNSCGYMYDFNVSFFIPSSDVGKCVLDPGPCQPVYNNNYSCCGNIFGGYITNPDGTISCGNLYNSIYSTFQWDPYNMVVVDEKTIIYYGVWQTGTDDYKNEYDCMTQKTKSSAYETWSFGSVTVIGV